MTNLRTLLRYAGLALGLLFSGAGLHAQGNYDLSWTLRPGDPAPVAPQLVSAAGPVLNNNGDISFVADGGVLFTSGGVTTIVAGFGDSLPGNATFNSIIGVSKAPLNAQGQIVFQAIFSPGLHAGIFLSSGGSISKITVDGDPGPGGETLFFGGLEAPAINEAGQVAFTTFSTIGNALYLYSEGRLTRLALQGDPAPGGGTFLRFTSPSINSSAQVAFQASVSTGSSGVFLAAGGTITKIARMGEPAPGGAIFAAFRRLSLNDTGQVAFVSTIALGGLSALHLYTGSQITELAREGNPAPGGGDFSSFDSPSLNGNGQVAFQGGLSTGNAGIFLFSEGSLTSIVRPGTPSLEGDLFNLSFTPSINDAGDVAFASLLNNRPSSIYLSSGANITRIAGSGDAVARDPKFFLGFGIAINSAGTVISLGASFPGGNGLYDDALNSIAHTGDPAPGGGVLGTTELASINDNGDVVFRSSLSTLGSGLIVSSGGALTRLVATGDPAPGGGTFLSFLDFPSINNLGQIAFAANLTAPARSGIFLSSEAGFTPLVQLGDAAPGGGTFSSLRFSWLNDAGQVAFHW